MPLQRVAFHGLGASPEADALRQLENRAGRTPIFGSARIVTTATTILDSDQLLLANTTGAGFTIMLPVAKLHVGRRFDVKLHAGVNTVTVDGDGAETIDGALTKAWNTTGTSFTFQSVELSTGTFGWVIV